MHWSSDNSATLRDETALLQQLAILARSAADHLRALLCSAAMDWMCKRRMHANESWIDVCCAITQGGSFVFGSD
jgi:uncharacterized protein (DUF488 family)